MNFEGNPANSSDREAVVNVPPETTDGDGVINKALEKPIVRRHGQIWKDIDFPAAPVVKASLPSGPAVIAVAAPPEPSTRIARKLRIINKRRFPNSVVKDVKVGHEVLVVNEPLTTILLDQPEAFNENQEPVVADKLISLVDSFYESTIWELGSRLGLPATVDNPADPSLKAVNTVKGSDHVPSTVSEGRVATFSMDMDEKGVPSFVPSLDLRRPTPVEGAEVLANLV